MTMATLEHPQWVAAAVAVTLGFWAVGAYHRLVGLRGAVSSTFLQVDDLLRQRHATGQALLDTLGPVLASEQSTLDAVALALQQVQMAASMARPRPCLAEPVNQLSAAESALASALGRLLALIDAHTEELLVARNDVTPLVNELRGLDAKLTVAKHVFNDAGRHYNQAVEQFPTHLLTRVFRFGKTGQL